MEIMPFTDSLSAQVSQIIHLPRRMLLLQQSKHQPYIIFLRTLQGIQPFSKGIAAISPVAANLCNCTVSGLERGDIPDYWVKGKLYAALRGRLKSDAEQPFDQSMYLVGDTGFEPVTSTV